MTVARIIRLSIERRRRGWRSFDWRPSWPRSAAATSGAAGGCASPCLSHAAASAVAVYYYPSRLSPAACRPYAVVCRDFFRGHFGTRRTRLVKSFIKYRTPCERRPTDCPWSAAVRRSTILPRDGRGRDDDFDADHVGDSRLGRHQRAWQRFGKLPVGEDFQTAQKSRLVSFLNMSARVICLPLLADLVQQRMVRIQTSRLYCNVCVSKVVGFDVIVTKVSDVLYFSSTRPRGGGGLAVMARGCR